MRFNYLSDKKIDLVIILLLFAMAFFIRFALISKGPYHLDCLSLARNAQRTLDTFRLHYQQAPGYPLAVVMGSLFVFFMRLLRIHDAVFSVNLMSVIFGSLDIVIFYLVAKKILSHKTSAIAAGLFLCFLPLHISVSTFGMTHTLAIFFNLLGIYFLFSYFANFKVRTLIISAFFLGCASAVRLSDSLIILPILFLFLMNLRRRYRGSNNIQMLYNLILLLGVYVLTITIFYLPAFFTGGMNRLINYARSLYYLKNALIGLLLSTLNLKNILGFYGVVLTIIGSLYFLREKGKTLFLFLAIWFFVLFTYNGSLSIVVSRYLLICLLPIFLWQGYCIYRLARIKKVGILVLILTAVVVINNFIQIIPVLQFRHNYNLQKMFAEFVSENTEPDSYVVAMDEGPFIEYYAHRKILYKTIGFNKQDFDRFFKKLDRILDKNNNIYIISTGIYGYDPKRYFIKTLLDKYKLEYIGRHFNQDWHRDSTKNRFIIESLYKISKQNNKPLINKEY